MGEVYEGRDRYDGSRVAIKRLKPGLALENPDYVARFVRECEILGRLEHPNIVKTLAVVPGSPPILVMEFVAGGSLRQLLREQAPLPLERALRIALELADALCRAHHMDVIHRDLKPENVLIGDDGSPRLSDFGVARLGERSLTAPGAMLGTLGYLSPEAVWGEDVDERTDIWSLGVLLFEMLTGERPFTGDSAAATVAAILERPVPDIGQRCPAAPAELAAVLSGMLQKNRTQRIASARHVAADIEAILRARSGRPPSEPSPTRLQRGSDARPALGPLSATVTLRWANLPAATTRFVGRADQLERLSALLADPAVRLLTLVGPGGVGKSRLAAECCRRFLAMPHCPFERGVVFVDLTPLTSAELIAPALASAVSVRPWSTGDPLRTLLDYFRDKQALLLMDNFEHLLPGSHVVSKLLENAPALKVLATSRQPLKLSGETLLPLDGLSILGSASAAPDADGSAVRLFTEAARRVRHDFGSNAVPMDDVVRICEVVGGMPLGILLAASLARTMSAREIADEVSKDLDVLHTDLVDIPERQHSLRAVFEHSWRLASEPERSALAAISTFRGGFTRAAAELVAGASLHTLIGLVDKSLLARDPVNGRYVMHELVRQYSEEKLRERPVAHAEVRERFAEYYSNFLRRHGLALQSSQQRDSLEEIDAELMNVRCALQLSLASRRLDRVDRGMDALALFYEARRSRTEAEAQFRAIVEAFRDHPSAGGSAARVIGIALSVCAACCDEQGRNAEAQRLASEALELLSPDAHPRERARALLVSSVTRFAEGAGRIEQAEEAAELCRRVNDDWGLARSLFRLGLLRADSIDDVAKAVECLHESVRMQLAGANPYGMPRSLAILGALRCRQGAMQEGREHIEAGLAIARTLDEGSVQVCLHGLAQVQRDMGDYAGAEASAREALGISEELGRRVTWALIGLGDAVKEQGRLDEAASTYAACIARFPGDLLAKHTAQFNLADVATRRGALAEAKLHGQAALLGFERLGVGWGLMLALDNLAEVACLERDFALASAHLRRACGLVVAAKATNVLTPVAAGVATLCAQTERPFLAAVLLELIDRQPSVPAHVRSRRVDRLWSTLRRQLPPHELLRAAELARTTQLESALARFDADTLDVS